MTRLLGLVAAMVLTASVVTAEPLKIPLSVYASAAAIDLHSTYRFLHYDGLYEGNPLGGWLETQPKTLVVFSATLDAAAVYGLHRWLGKRHTRLARVVLYTAAGVRVMAAVHNYRSTAGRVRR